ncbi:uncharacterized protein K460DRAFT_363488 [Cucurbitaria berberidis CBS 394.84]|uniref:Uncharacterized protein n=1 Tax=Cucurbitaria berberidis CBS 394.84 TaxID=1168544 RepID=A0A9P4GJI7_9PLEO|nr:uncharacterized protein K460DRAFT_363488 [Cucurbitaria berberidis CBS 394.84]KAF1847413.1 hypothetical protein K460DRAFT_363488 [Cucurbitaria berberidis CBS 394.84]
MEYNVDDSDRSSSPPPTPTDKPLRSKRSHNRKATPTAGGQVGGMPGGQQHQSPGSTHHQSLLHQMNPMSSAQSTPDPSRQPNSYFSAMGGATATSPHGVNGAPVLPPLHALPPLQPQQQAPPRAAYFDPAYDEQRPTPAENDGEGERRRAYSGAQQPTTESAPPQNGDTEMTDAGFTAVNR